MCSLINVDDLIEMIENHNKLLGKYDEYKKKYGKQIRNLNYPEHISETFCAYVLKYKYDLDDISRECKGDLTSKMYPVIEIKTFSSCGPSSFGPFNEWDLLVFLDARNYREWSIWTSNKCTRNILNEVKVNKNETFGDQARNNRRPRLTFDELKKKLPENTFIKIFSGCPLEFLKQITPC
jgi:hypothetical protein